MIEQHCLAYRLAAASVIFSGLPLLAGICFTWLMAIRPDLTAEQFADLLHLMSGPGSIALISPLLALGLGMLADYCGDTSARRTHWLAAIGVRLGLLCLPLSLAALWGIA